MALMTSSQFRIVVEPIYAEEFDSVYDLRKDEWKRLFDERTGDAHAYHEEPILYGFGAAPELPEGTSVTFSSGGLLYSARYLYKVYGLGFAITKVLVEDTQHIKLGTIYSRHLAQSMIETKETVAANILNRAFNSSYAGGDGKSLCASGLGVAVEHPVDRGGAVAHLAGADADPGPQRHRLERQAHQPRRQAPDRAAVADVHR